MALMAHGELGDRRYEKLTPCHDYTTMRKLNNLLAVLVNMTWGEAAGQKKGVSNHFLVSIDRLTSLGV